MLFSSEVDRGPEARATASLTPIDEDVLLLEFSAQIVLAIATGVASTPRVSINFNKLKISFNLPEQADFPLFLTVIYDVQSDSFRVFANNTESSLGERMFLRARFQDKDDSENVLKLSAFGCSADGGSSDATLEKVEVRYETETGLIN